jgi:hypothetical protein
VRQRVDGRDGDAWAPCSRFLSAVAEVYTLDARPVNRLPSIAQAEEEPDLP